MIIHENIVQGSKEWYDIKAGRFSGTDAELFTVGKGIGKGLQTAIYKKAAELVRGLSISDSASPAMQRGTALEPLARKAYTLATFQDVREVGFIEFSQYAGVSPDGLVGDDGAIEIKCPQGKGYVRWLVESKDDPIVAIPKDYYCQMQWLLMISNRQWCDYVVYHPDFAPQDLSITRVERDEDLINLMTLKMVFVGLEMKRVLSIIGQKEAA